jgi:hypothetical protein
VDARVSQRAICAQTNDAHADGEVVWSRRPDAGAKFGRRVPRLASDGGKKARLTEESAL